MRGLLAPSVPRTLKLLCVAQVLGYVKHPAKFQHRISMHHAVMRYVFTIGLPYVPKNGVLGVFEGDDLKMLCSNPRKTLPCVNTRMLVYRVSKSVQRPRSVERWQMLFNM